MKKILIFSSLIAVLLLSSCEKRDIAVIDGTNADGFEIQESTPEPVETLAPEERDFRGIKWGMSLSDVTKNEGEGYTTIEEGVIRYNNITVAGLPADAEYSFEDGKLNCCIYYTTHSHSDVNEYITDYNNTIEKYVKKYGDYLNSDIKWGDGVEQDKSKVAELLEKGQIMYKTGWKKSNTEINLVLFKDNDGRIKIGIRYIPIDINAEGDVAPQGDLDI